MGGWALVAIVFGPGVALGIWFGWRGQPAIRSLGIAVVLTFIWGMGVWFSVFGAFATAAESLRIAAIAVGIAIVNAGLPFGAARLIKRAW